MTRSTDRHEMISSEPRAPWALKRRTSAFAANSSNRPQRRRCSPRTALSTCRAGARRLASVAASMPSAGNSSHAKCSCQERELPLDVDDRFAPRLSSPPAAAFVTLRGSGAQRGTAGLAIRHLWSTWACRQRVRPIPVIFGHRGGKRASPAFRASWPSTRSVKEPPARLPPRRPGPARQLRRQRARRRLPPPHRPMGTRLR